MHGSQNFLQSLIAADLVDEFRLMIFPLILGSGKKLFAAGGVPAGLRLTKHRVAASGVIIAWYEKAHQAAKGSFAL